MDLANHDGAGLNRKPSGQCPTFSQSCFGAVDAVCLRQRELRAGRDPPTLRTPALLSSARLSLGAPLTGIRAKLQSGKGLTVVALGSSSTTGFGTGSGGAFPDVMKRELMRLRPSAQIELINSGRIMDNIPGNVGRLGSDVLNHKPDLVVWQLGSNDAVWRGIAGNVKEMITNAVKRLKAANADIVLVDLQYAPLVLASDRHVRMEKIIAEVAREQNVGLFPGSS